MPTRQLKHTDLPQAQADGSERGERAQLAALQQAAAKGWADVDAGHFVDISPEGLADFIGQLGLRATTVESERPASIPRHPGAHRNRT